MRFFSSVIQSLHNPVFYQRVFRNEQGGVGFAYLFKLLSASWLVISILLMLLVMEARRNPEDNALMLPTQLLRKIAPQFPPIKIVNGRVVMTGEEPFTIYDPDTGLPLMIIDVTGKSRSDGKTETQIFLNRSTISFRYEGEDIVYDLPPELNTEITSGKLEEWASFLERTMPYAPFVMLPFNVLASLLAFGLRWLLMGGIVYIALKTRFEDASPSAAMRLAAYALTAPILLKMLMIGSGFQPFGAPEMVVLALSMLYLYFAVSSVLKTAK